MWPSYVVTLPYSHWFSMHRWCDYKEGWLYCVLIYIVALPCNIITINVSGQGFFVSRTIIKRYPKIKLAKELTNFKCLNKLSKKRNGNTILIGLKLWTRYMVFYEFIWIRNYRKILDTNAILSSLEQWRKCEPVVPWSITFFSISAG